MAAAGPRRPPSRLLAAASGVIAGGLGLGFAELVAGLLPGAASPILAIGSLVVALQPPNAKQLVVDLFGTNDKLALEVAVLVGALVLSAVLGVLARRSERWAQAGFIGLGVLALGAALRDPLVDILLAGLTAALSVCRAETRPGGRTETFRKKQANDRPKRAVSRYFGILDAVPSRRGCSTSTVAASWGRGPHSPVRPSRQALPDAFCSTAVPPRRTFLRQVPPQPRCRPARSSRWKGSRRWWSRTASSIGSTPAC